MREAGLEDINDYIPSEQELREAMGMEDVEKTVQDLSSDLSDWTTPNQTIQPPSTTQNPKSNKPETASKKTKTKDGEPADTDWSTPRPKPKSDMEPSKEISPGENGSHDEPISPDSGLEKPTTTYPPPIEKNIESSEPENNA